MSETASRASQLYPTMGVLNNALKRVSDAWNDTVASAIEANHVNQIIIVCNQANGQVASSAWQINAKMARLEELAR